MELIGHSHGQKFKTNSSFQVKEYITGKNQLLFFSSSVLVLLIKFSLWKKNLALGYKKYQIIMIMIV